MKTTLVPKEGKAPARKAGPGRPKGEERRRIHVTLSLESWRLVEEIATLTKSPRASILSEVFDSVLPSFVNTIEALRVAKEQPREAQRLVQNFAAQSVMALQQQNLELDAKITAHEAKNKAKAAKKGRVRNAST